MVGSVKLCPDPAPWLPHRCALFNGGWLLGACRILLAALLLVGVHLMLLRRSRYVRHREWLVSGKLVALPIWRTDVVV